MDLSVSVRPLFAQRAGLTGGSVSDREPYKRHEELSSSGAHPCFTISAAGLFAHDLHHAGSSSAPDLSASLVGSANSARR